ncbi:MAG: glycoside hydrolase family 44 protein, partial [Terracidiphilus sp.]
SLCFGTGVIGCGSSATTYTLTVNSNNPVSGTQISISPADNNGQSNGSTSFTRNYNAGTAVTLTAPATVGSNHFSSWSGCATASSTTCNVSMNSDIQVTARYNSVAVTPNPAAAIIGSQVQFSATINGAAGSVNWTLASPNGNSLSPGTISSTGLYTTPYPAPPTVTVTATSAADITQSASVTVSLSQPAASAGPALSVDAGAKTHAISPYIYGMNAWALNTSAADVTAVANANITIDRWGGDSTERYNYKLDVTNWIGDWMFENASGNDGDYWNPVHGTNAFNLLVQSNNQNGIKTVGTVPVLGWVAKDSTSCSFPTSTYPNQQKTDGSRGCGNGMYAQGVNGCTGATGCKITGNDPTVTSIAELPPTPPAASDVNAAWALNSWTGGWVDNLVNTAKFGPGNPNGPNGALGTGVAIYDLDNEPSWWYIEDFDVHPLPFTYDEVTNGGIGTALAIKTIDPTAEVSGPVMDYWWGYFYSAKDFSSGWATGPCYEPWSNPADRTAHGGTPFIEYYLQQFAGAEKTYGKRLIDYLDLHTYFAATYNGSSVALTTAGDTGEQQARINSTRALWDSTYTDPNFTQPNYFTDANYTSSCTVPLQAPQLINLMKDWVAKDYPGTKLAIDEYNWGGMEAINGALTQADILGIFGREGLDLATMWPTTNPALQIPGTMAFAIYRNYDGNKSTFGNEALTSTSVDQSKLSVYGALRTTDNTLTIVVINKTYGDLTSTLNLPNFIPAGAGKAFLYSNANLAAIVSQPYVTVTPPGAGSTTSTITRYTFPAQSITLLAISKQ